jgi:pimeloyl-ACP methyl ester carboxylesterase
VITSGKEEIRMQYVTIHANSTSSRLMEGVSCATLNISLPGHDGVPLADDYCLPNLRQYVMEKVGREDTVFIGHSIGGMLAYEVADQVNTKAIISVGIPPLNYEVLDGFMLENRCTALATTPDLTGAQIRELAEELVECPDKRKILEQSIRESDPGVREGLLKSILAGDLLDERAILEKLDIPMLFIACRRDVIVNNRKFDDLGFGRVLEVDAGHLFPFEEPVEFNRIIGHFLEHNGLT